MLGLYQEGETPFMSSIFPFWHILLTAGIASGGTLLGLLGARSWVKSLKLGEMVVIALVVGLSVVFWRSAANTASLNDDPIPGVSPNDALCPMITSIFLGLYAAIRPPVDPIRYAQVRAALTFLSFVVNVITI